MESALIIALTLAVLVGVSLGLLGGGGSILTVPILTYLVGMEPRDAIAASLFIVGVTSAVSVFSHARAARVRWKTGLIFGAAGMVGAFAGGLAGGHIPGALLMLLFAAMMIATATAMIRGRKHEAAAPRAPARGGGVVGRAAAEVIGDSNYDADLLNAAVEPTTAATLTAVKTKELPLFRILLDGFAVGIATGLVGAGGGFLVVPALNLLGGLPMAVAVGTSLLVIAMKSFAGLSGYLFSAHIDWPVVLGFTALAVAGSFVGARLAGIVPEKALRKGFGWFVLAMGAFVLVQEVPPIIGAFA